MNHFQARDGPSIAFSREEASLLGIALDDSYESEGCMPLPHLTHAQLCTLHAFCQLYVAQPFAHPSTVSPDYVSLLVGVDESALFHAADFVLCEKLMEWLGYRLAKSWLTKTAQEVVDSVGWEKDPHYEELETKYKEGKITLQQLNDYNDGKSSM